MSLLLTMLLPMVAKAGNRLLNVWQADGTIAPINLNEESAKDYDEDGVWHRTVIVSTLDGITMEYLIDKDTKVRIEKPNLVIETEGMVLTYELESMGQVKYGRRFIPSGIENVTEGGSPFTLRNETLFFDHLGEDALIEVYATDGKTVRSSRFNNHAEISLVGQPDGVYLVKVNDETYKILKR